MKFKKLIGKITAFVLAGTMMLGNVPIYADTAANSGADVFATQGSDFTIRIPKQLVLSGDEGTGAYRVAVKGNISGTDIITVTPDAEFYMKQEGKSDILATITQPKTDFTYADGVRPEAEVTSDGVIEMASISAGKWSGLFNFTVTSSVDLSLEDSIGSDKADISTTPVVGNDVSQDKHSEYDSVISGTTNVPSETPTSIKVTATNSNGDNLNVTASTIVGSEAKKLLDSLNESGLIEDTEEVDALIEVESDDFEGIADTTFDVSDIANPGDTVVILHFDEEKQMWEHIGTETVDENGKVNGDFTSYSPVAFVKVDSNGNIETHLHDFEKIAQEPTCTETGLKTFTCSECSYVYKEVIDPLGHDYKTSSTASSCTEEGYTTYTCERCGDSYVDDTVPALGHSYGDWVTVKEPNCTETGNKQKTCSVCGDVVTESINALGHSWNSDYTVDKEATCTVTGSKSIHCSVCNVTKDTTTIPVKEHSYGNWTTVKEPTCTETGSKQKTCSACGDVVTESVDALGHSWNSDYTVDKEATCTATGSKSIHCSECNITKDVTSLPIKEHNIVNDKCINCNFINAVAGLYDANNTLLCSYEDSGIDAEINYTSSSYKTAKTSPYYVITYNYPTTAKIILPEGITNIGNYSFCGCSSLIDIGIPSTITRIGICAFGGCNFTNVVLPNSITDIDSSAFNICKKLTNINIPSSVTYMGSTVFNNCDALSTINLENGITTICTNSFENSTGLTSITIPNSVIKIEDGAFRDCTNLTSIIIPSSVTTIGKSAFSECTKLSNVIISEGVTDIGDGAFYNCTDLTSITIPSTVKNIGKNAFLQCRNLLNVNILEGVTNIGDYAFNNCNSLTSITIPSTVKNIGERAFYNCNTMTNITILNGVEVIGKLAFYSCEKVTDIVIPPSVTTIKQEAFSDCTNLTNVTLSEGLIKIDSYVFDNCESIISITIPSTVTNIGYEAFSSSNKALDYVIFEAPDGWYVGSREGEKTTALSSTDLLDPSKASYFFKITHRKKYWSK